MKVVELEALFAKLKSLRGFSYTLEFECSTGHPYNPPMASSMSPEELEERKKQLSELTSEIAKIEETEL